MKPYINAVIIGICAVVCFGIVAHAYKYRSTSAETIEVTGLASKDFNSDLIVWNASYSRKAADLKTAYAELRKDEDAIRTYLTKKGINNQEMVFSAVSISKQFEPVIDQNGRNAGQKLIGYNLQQDVNIESSDVDKVEKISREATELIESGIEFNSNSPAYYNTKLNEVKMELLAKASADAKARATAIAENAGNSLGKLRHANMGVFQITGKNSNDNFSYGGSFNTASRRKTGSITIKMEFQVN